MKDKTNFKSIFMDLLIAIYSSSYSQLSSVSRQDAHSRSVVFHTLHRDLRYTRLFP